MARSGQRALMLTSVHMNNDGKSQNKSQRV